MNKQMAAERIEAIRRSIRSKELIDVLTGIALDPEADPKDRIAAAKDLLGYDMPKLKAVEHTGDVDGTFRLLWDK